MTSTPIVSELLSRAKDFRAKVTALKAAIPHPGWEWYPYDSLSTLLHLGNLFGEDFATLFDLARQGVTLDLGCGDGEFAFFLESLGCETQALDFSTSNQNHMRGVRALGAALGSKIRIDYFDLDRQFVLPLDHYRLVFCLGVLYHLKNPLYALEQLSKQSDYCVLSTRIADRLGKLSLKDQPVAYLLDDDELNNDDSNYWIFSEAGLRRLLKRCNWEVLRFASVGDRNTGPADPARDLRAFCFLRSRYSLANLELVRGWHDDEGQGWRWTQREFSVRIRELAAGRTARVTTRLFLPDALLERSSAITMSVSVAGRELSACSYSESGRHTHVFELTPSETAPGAVQLDYALSYALPPEPSDNRERGIIVYAISWETS